MTNWKTTTTGILAIVLAICTAAKNELDADPATVADWSLVATSVLAGVGLILAKDAKPGDAPAAK
jgi:hypothetical protein